MPDRAPDEKEVQQRHACWRIARADERGVGCRQRWRMAWPTASSDSRGNARRKAAAVTNHADPEVLAHVGLFADLTTPELIGLARLMRPRAYARDEVIYLRGDPGMAFYVIASGRVKIALTSPDGKEIILRRLGPGGFHGELALLGDRPRSADAISTEPLARVLLSLASEDGNSSDLPPPGAVIPDRMKQGELAALVGATRESINKWLGAFEKQGLIRYDKGQITLLRPSGLQQRIY